MSAALKSVCATAEIRDKQLKEVCITECCRDAETPIPGRHG